MNPAGSLKLVSGVRDLQIVDADGRLCGIVDDIEFDGAPGKPLRIKAILVGPGAYRGRLPGWAVWLIERVAGNRIVRVPWSEVKSITSAVHLRGSGDRLGLTRSEDRARQYIPRAGAL